MKRPQCFPPDEKLGVIMSTRFSPKTNCAILGLVPRPHSNILMSSIYNIIYLYSVAGSRFYRKGNVGPVLVEIEKSINKLGYMGVPLNDPKEEWIYHSPISWHPEGKKAMWQEQMRGGSNPRIRIVELFDYAPRETVPAQNTPDDIPYAISEPDINQNADISSGKIAGKLSGYIDCYNNRSLPEKGIVSQSQSLYVDYSDNNGAIYNGYEKTKIFKDGKVVYEADLKLTGTELGKMKMKLNFTSGGYESPPKLSFGNDENGQRNELWVCRI